MPLAGDVRILITVRICRPSLPAPARAHFEDKMRRFNSSSHRADITATFHLASLRYRQPADNRDRLINLVEVVRLR